ncbi:unnamed protein product [Sphagnum troendelagicum]|uniref:NAD-dependent epimerase/dehydratase domain-containing protein n=1 Tax=Sphagnum troendelagicum TaxID=128251 RepID=A0ABP0U2L1_9BRYO
MAGETVCVTGASGLTASWLVKLLLERRHTVRGTFRSPVPGANDHLKLVPADLLEQGSFDQAVEGCDGVFHTASLFFTKNITDPQAQLIDPAVKGTLNVLASCVKAHTRKVVVTSSVAAVAYTPELKSTSVVDESWWSDSDYCQETSWICQTSMIYDAGLAWYFVSKTLAERAAWDFVKEKNLDMVFINPSMVLGPVLQGSKNTSNDIILDFLNGEHFLNLQHMFRNSCIGCVGVKNVAMAHILAYESATATGCYICAEQLLHYADLVALLSKLYPTYPICAKDAEETEARVPVFTLSAQKVKDLGLNFQPIEEVIHETVTSFKEWGWLA